MAAYPIAAVKAFKGNATYGDDDYVDEYSVKSFDDQLQASAKQIPPTTKQKHHALLPTPFRKIIFDIQNSIKA